MQMGQRWECHQIKGHAMMHRLAYQTEGLQSIKAMQPLTSLYQASVAMMIKWHKLLNGGNRVRPS